MPSHLERKVKALISAHHKLLALVNICEIQQQYAPNLVQPEAEAYLLRLKCLLNGIDTLLLLVPEEERFILTLHLVDRMKWESVVTEYQRRWPYDAGTDMRTYLYRQQSAFRKICHFIEHFSGSLDFSWLDDPIINEVGRKP